MKTRSYCLTMMKLAAGVLAVVLALGLGVAQEKSPTEQSKSKEFFFDEPYHPERFIKAVQQQLTRFAEGTGGRYHSAQDGETLARALLIAAVEKMPFEVFDAGGQQVAKGETDSPAVELPPGSYRVVIQAPGQELVAGNVTIGVRGDAALKIVLKGDRFELER